MSIKINILTDFSGGGIKKAKEEFKALETRGQKAGFALKKAFAPALVVVGAGVKIAQDSIAAFASYEQGLKEVFTLMPGLSAKAEKDISKDVKKFSKSFGVLPEKVIPALYQAISAGVPPDNVFEFLKTAQQAAKGGVTDLTTAVDGITSVVNAYGSEVVDATKASDLMFTAVKLGKTDFNQLSSSLFQVAPIAASLGVDFEYVTAALATLTAQGTPTSVAATQMKAAMSELGKEGTKADQAFREMTGKSFPTFIQEGGKVDEAFLLIADGATKSGKSVLDVFGSIEAGQAILSLTANEGKAFSDALNEMGDASGATKTAFDKMEEGINPAIEKMQAAFAVMRIEIGEKFGPTLEKIFNFVTDHATIFAIFGGILFGLASAIVLVNIAMKAWSGITKAFTGIQFAFNAVMAANPILLIVLGIAALIAILVAAYFKFDGFRKIVDKVFGAIKTGVKMAIDQFKSMVNIVKEVFNGIARLWNNTFGKLKITIPNIKGLPGRGQTFSIPQIPMLADGGIVKASPGGTLAIIGEGGKDEAVIPLDRMGSMGGNNVTINVNGGDPQAVVDALRRYMYQNGTIPIRVSG
jgi:TP901 family phage tail tape measure protein